MAEQEVHDLQDAAVVISAECGQQRVTERQGRYEDLAEPDTYYLALKKLFPQILARLC